MTAAVVVTTVGAILVGTVLQRLSGNGVGLVVAPVLAVLMGPALGVLITNSTTVVCSFLVMLATVRDVDWKRCLIFIPFALPGAVLAAFVVRGADPAWLNIVIGSVVLVALVLTFGTPAVPHVRSHGLTAATGLVSGFLNTCAGVAAPVMVMYAKFTRWDQRSYAATLQPTYWAMGTFALAMMLMVGTTDSDQVPPWWLFVLILITVVVGVMMGTWLAREVSVGTARRVAITLGGLGSVTAILRGVLMLA